MADIDMIPREYRDGVRVRRTVRLAGIALALVVAAGALGGIGLRWRGAVLGRAVLALQASAAQAQADSARGAQLHADQARREQDRAVLRTLRRQGEFAALARGLDASLSDAVWLTELRVEHDVQAVSPAAGAAASAPPADEGIEEFSAPAAASTAQSWRMRSSVEIGGQAANYGAVTAFLSALGRQPGIAGLHLVSSSAAQDGGAIDFRATGSLLQTRTTP